MARSTASISIDVTYGSRLVMPKRQHSVDEGQLVAAWSASVSAYSARSSASSASSLL